MGSVLPAPEVVRTFFEESFTPRLPAICLRWEPADRGDRLWELPEGLTLVGPPPTRFGLSVQRLDAELYQVRLLWDRTGFVWPELSRLDLLTCSLEPLLRALGTDLWHLLEQPIPGTRKESRTAA